MAELEQLVMKCRDAMAGGFDSLSTSEQLAAALVLNRFDWLATINFTIAEAIERIGEDWVALIPAASKALKKTDATIASIQRAAHDESVIASLSEEGAVVDVSATIVTYGDAPGYRDATFTFDLQRPGSPSKHRICFRIDPKDGESVVRHIIEVHRWAWNRGEPLDIKPGEQRPGWIDGF